MSVGYFRKGDADWRLETKRLVRGEERASLRFRFRTFLLGSDAIEPAGIIRPFGIAEIGPTVSMRVNEGVGA